MLLVPKYLKFDKSKQKISKFKVNGKISNITTTTAITNKNNNNNN